MMTTSGGGGLVGASISPRMVHPPPPTHTYIYLEKHFNFACQKIVHQKNLHILKNPHPQCGLPWLG